MLDTRSAEDAAHPTRQVRPLPPLRIHADPRAFLERLVNSQLLDRADAEGFTTALPGLHDRTDRGVGLALVQARFLQRSFSSTTSWPGPATASSSATTACLTSSAAAAWATCSWPSTVS